MPDVIPAAVVLETKDLVAGGNVGGCFMGDATHAVFVTPSYAGGDNSVAVIPIDPTSTSGIGSDGTTWTMPAPDSAIPAPPGSEGSVSVMSCIVSKVVPVSNTEFLVAANVVCTFPGPATTGHVITYRMQAEVIWLLDTSLSVVAGPKPSWYTYFREDELVSTGGVDDGATTTVGSQIGLFALKDGVNVRVLGMSQSNDDVFSSTLTRVSTGNSASLTQAAWRADQVWYYNGSHVVKAVANGNRTNSINIGTVSNDTLGNPWPVSVALIGDGLPLAMAAVGGVWKLFDTAGSYDMPSDDAPIDHLLYIGDFAWTEFDGGLGIGRWFREHEASDGLFHTKTEASGWAWSSGSDPTKTDDWVDLLDTRNYVPTFH